MVNTSSVPHTVKKDITSRCVVHAFFKTFEDTFTNFQTGSNMDAADDLIASAIAGGPVASHV
jgi:hypothetical protein